MIWLIANGFQFTPNRVPFVRLHDVICINIYLLLFSFLLSLTLLSSLPMIIFQNYVQPFSFSEGEPQKKKKKINGIDDYNLFLE